MNKILHSYFTLLITVISTNLVHAQLKEVVAEPPYIKSVTFYNQYNNDFSPVVKLGDGFSLSFDDLSGSQEDYTYQIIHCDYNWQPTDLATTAYIEGYDSDRIRDFENSFNTFQPYTHYQFSIPNQHTAIKLSGNYIIAVLDEQETVIFSRPVIIYESLVTTGISAHKSKTIANISTHQRLEVLVDYPNFRINNPSKEIKIMAIQNFDWHRQIKNITPQFYRGTQLIYNQNELSFSGGNEFLYFDTKEARNPVNKIAKVELKDRFNTYLYSDEPRAGLPYTYNPDINGNFLVRTIDNDDAQLEADYIEVYFSLKSPVYQEHDLYVYGNFNNWQLSEETKMTYQEHQDRYTAKLLLKQGVYNYSYMATDKNNTLKPSLVEGSFYQTENDYAVFVYHRPFGSRYDRIIGFGRTKAEKLRN